MIVADSYVLLKLSLPRATQKLCSCWFTCSRLNRNIWTHGRQYLLI